MLHGTVIKLDNVSYGSFPTAKELYTLSSNLVISFIDFIRSLGINGREKLANAFRSSLEDIDRLCVKCHMNAEVDNTSIERAVEMRRIWQRNILKGSVKRFEVNLKDILKRTHDRSPFYKLDAVAKEVQYYLINFVKNLTSGRNKTKGVIDQEKVNEILSNCHLEPIRSWKKASENHDYVRILMTEAFPHTPTSIMVNYLFTDDSPIPQNITYYCTRHRISRFEITHNSSIHHDEQIAFIKWVGYDVTKFIKEQSIKITSWRNYL